MRIHLNLLPRGDVLQKPVTIEQECGLGRQTLYWLGSSQSKRYLPQAILDTKGTPLDPHIVLNELVTDGDELNIEFSDGPLAFSTSDEVVPGMDVWLRKLDLKELLSPFDFGPCETKLIAADVQALQDLILNASGQLQAAFFIHQLKGENSTEDLSSLSLVQLRLIMIAAKVIDSFLGTDKGTCRTCNIYKGYEKANSNDIGDDAQIDLIFSQLEASQKVKCFKKESPGPSRLNFLGYLLALVNVAALKYLSELPQGTDKPLSTSFHKLITLHFDLYVFPDIMKKVDKLKGALTPKTLALLEKGRHLTLQTLSACQFKRLDNKHVRLEVSHMFSHLAQWRILGKEISIEDLGAMIVFAKHPGALDVSDYTLKEEPYHLDGADFERFLAALSFFLYTLHKRKDAVEDYLGEFLADIYRKSGVMQNPLD